MSISAAAPGSGAPQPDRGRTRLEAVPSPQQQSSEQAPLRVVEVCHDPWSRRLAERALALLALLLLLPVLVTVAVLVRATSPGPVLFRHTRVGHGGRPFSVIKFRTMHADAEQRVRELMALNTASGPLFKIRHDPRITPLGRHMRRLSLDELPQLWNVVNGTMSLVGPRPSSPDEVARFTPAELRRHSVRPGLTGLAQVSGRSDLEWDEAIALDLHYVEHRSPLLDLRIVLRTLPAVLSGRGAY